MNSGFDLSSIHTQNNSCSEKFSIYVSASRYVFCLMFRTCEFIAFKCWSKRLNPAKIEFESKVMRSHGSLCMNLHCSNFNYVLLFVSFWEFDVRRQFCWTLHLVNAYSTFGLFWTPTISLSNEMQYEMCYPFNNSFNKLFSIDFCAHNHSSFAFDQLNWFSVDLSTSSLICFIRRLEIW